jgi:hypothetical protein
MTIRPGDILEITAPKGIGYIQFIGVHDEYGDAIVVEPRLYAKAVADITSLFRDGYVSFYPARLAAKKLMARVIGNSSPPRMPERLRRPGARHGRRVETWVIEEGSEEQETTHLTSQELNLPIAAIWNHEFLIERIAEGWRPTQEGAA